MESHDRLRNCNFWDGESDCPYAADENIVNVQMWIYDDNSHWTNGEDEFTCHSASDQKVANIVHDLTKQAK